MTTQIKHESGEVTLTIVVPAQQVKETFGRIKSEALKEVKVSGFRPGKAPSEISEQQLNEEALSQKLFQELIPVAYAQAVTREGIKPIVPPQISIKSFKRDEDLVLEAKTAERPKIVLGDFKKALQGLRGKTIYGPEEKPLEGGEKITAAQILEKLREIAKVDVPHLVIDYELQRMLSSLVDQVRSLGLTTDQYLSSQGKTAEGLRREYHEVAQRNLKDEFILSEISLAEKISVSEKEIQDAIDAAPDEKTKSGLAEERGRNYLEDILRKRKTIEHLLKLAEGNAD